MKLLGQVDLRVRGESILRSPTVLDRIGTAFGVRPDLRTSSVRSSLEAAAIVDAVRAALRRLGATNAVSLVIDDQVLYQDREGREDDLGDLFLAFHDHAAVFGREFTMLRLAVEHEEAGLHLVLEVLAQSVHPADEPSARIVVSGRVKDFEPRPGEDAEAYRGRVEPLTRNPVLYEAHRRQFESFVSRVADAMRAAMPEARVQVSAAEALVQQPSRVPARRQPEPADPTSPRYDPHDLYYPNPYGFLLQSMVWSSIFSMAMAPPVMIVNDRGDALGTPDEVGPDGMDNDGEAGDGGDDDFDDGGFDGEDFGGE